MPRTASPAGLADRIQQLLDDRDRHAQAIEEIDQTLNDISNLLGRPVRVGRPKRQVLAALAPAEPAAKGRRAKRRTYETTAEESILAFIKQEGNPTTREIRQHWASEGRRGTADNPLSRLVKDGKVERTPMEDERGSRYSLP